MENMNLYTVRFDGAYLSKGLVVVEAANSTEAREAAEAWIDENHGSALYHGELEYDGIRLVGLSVNRGNRPIVLDAMAVVE